MRASTSSRVYAPRVFAAVTAVVSLGAASALIAACADAPRYFIIPTGVGGQSAAAGAGGSGIGGASSSASGTGTGGGAPAVECASNKDCAFPDAVCDTVAKSCVECLVIADCATKQGTVCSKGACVCPVAADSFCPALGSLSDRCVAFPTSSTDCGTCGHACFGTCAAGKCADPWEPITTIGAPSPRGSHSAVWDATDNWMIVWGGIDNSGPLATGGIYDPAKATWTPISTVNAPAARYMATAVWDTVDKAMIVWGGSGPGGAPLGSGGIFNPKTNTWQVIPTDSAPSARTGNAAVWTGAKLLVWGGSDGVNYLSDGYSYDPAAHAWSTAIGSQPTGLTGRMNMTGVWTGTNLMVWGGYGTDGVSQNIYLGDGAAYSPAADSWTLLATSAAPSPRGNQTAVWTTSSSLLIFGGADTTGPLSTGDKYTVAGWFPMDNAAAPEPRQGHTAVWMDGSKEMIVWGGAGTGGVLLDSGYRLDEMTLQWSVPLPTAPIARQHHSALVNGTKMMIWGGQVAGGYTDSGAVLDTSAL